MAVTSCADESTTASLLKRVQATLQDPFDILQVVDGPVDAVRWKTIWRDGIERERRLVGRRATRRSRA